MAQVIRIRRVSGDGSVEQSPIMRRGDARLPDESQEDYEEYLWSIPADRALLAIGDEMAKELTGEIPAGTH